MHPTACRRHRFIGVAVAGLALASLYVHAQDTPPPAVPAAEVAPAPGPGAIRLLLPPHLYAVPGVETNVYFDNVCLALNPTNYAFDVTCGKGTQQTERWTFTPADTDVGEFPFLLEVRDAANRIVARAESRLRVTGKDAGAGRQISMLIIGDSLTNASVYPQQVLDLCKPEGNPKLTLVGSWGPGGKCDGECRHEGYGGWTALRFATHYAEGARTAPEAKLRGSPFLYKDGAAEPRLDFPRYCKEFNNGNAPDYVTILLGCNDNFSATDENIEERIDTMLKHYDALIDMIHQTRQDTTVGALLLVPAAATQDAFGANYKCGQTRWQYKRNQQRVVERMTERYGNREAERICLVPANVNLDCVNNYPSVKTPCNARSKTEIIRLNNGVHPSADGYRQIGDSIYCWLKAHLAALGSVQE